MSCSAPSPLMSVIWTTCPSAAVRIGIDLAVDRAADADIDHAAFGDAGAQGVVGVRHIGDAGTGRRLRCLIGLRCGAAWLGEEGARGPVQRVAGRCRCCLSAAAHAGEERDNVGAILLGLESRERHLVAGHDLLRIGEIGVERCGIPDDVRLLHCRRIIVVRRRRPLCGRGFRRASDRAGSCPVPSNGRLGIF